MNASKYTKEIVLFVLILLCTTELSNAWHDETHIAIAKATGYKKWFNAAGADMIKIKAKDIEFYNHYTNSSPGTIITAETVLDQIKQYNKIEIDGHLYGAIIASIREYLEETEKGKYSDYHLAFCAHYVGDLSQPLHNTLYNAYNIKYHAITDGIINDEVLNNLPKIKIYPINITSEKELAAEIARIANIALLLGYKIELENRLLTKAEAYQQISHSASLFQAILTYVKSPHHF